MISAEVSMHGTPAGILEEIEAKKSTALHILKNILGLQLR
jgi:hypothetical protein